MIVDVDPRSPVPPYEQLRSQISALIDAGSLPHGTQLPSIRQLASDLGLAPGTVARAYRELESMGLVSSRGRHGTRVAAHADAASRERRVAEAAEVFARDVRRLGVSPTAALRAVRHAFRDAHWAGSTDAT